MIESGKCYTGIGSRKTPEDVTLLMTSVAKKLSSAGMVLRSGGADGADTAFEVGVKDTSLKEIYLPWKGFNHRVGEDGICSYSDCHVDLAEATHPAWAFLGRGARALHTRNIAQVLGNDCNTPSNFVICWTKKGEVVGGTATAIKTAWARHIPVFNLFNKRAYDAMTEFVLTDVFDDEAWRAI